MLVFWKRIHEFHGIFIHGYAEIKAVAYIPAFLEDRASMVKERANGLYGPTAFLVANTIIGLPFLRKTPFEKFANLKC